MQLTLFVLCHESNALTAAPNAPHITKVWLPRLNPSNLLAESRIFTDSNLLLDCTSRYIGLCSQNWNTKYGGMAWNGGKVWRRCLPIEQLHTLPLEPTTVWAAAPIPTVFWSEELDRYFPGCHKLIGELIEHFNLRQHYRAGLWANNFIAHSNAVHNLTHFHRACHAYLSAKYGYDNLPLTTTSHTKRWSDRLPAFLHEGITALFFANSTQLSIKQIPLD